MKLNLYDRQISIGETVKLNLQRIIDPVPVQWSQGVSKINRQAWIHGEFSNNSIGNGPLCRLSLHAPGMRIHTVLIDHSLSYSSSNLWSSTKYLLIASLITCDLLLCSAIITFTSRLACDSVKRTLRCLVFFAIAINTCWNTNLRNSLRLNLNEVSMDVLEDDSSQEQHLQSIPRHEMVYSDIASWVYSVVELSGGHFDSTYRLRQDLPVKNTGVNVRSYYKNLKGWCQLPPFLVIQSLFMFSWEVRSTWGGKLKFLLKVRYHWYLKHLSRYRKARKNAVLRFLFLLGFPYIL